ncbi:MAG: HAMP domain-containing protein [Armatimonadota bacterium]|nr:HAMP domain-containing protein [Armatimonadota bacterium]MDR7426495.1 HAMP domain-containing protein [Armatimonadota bacterium]MDR7463392.1 HAMP domain-containing protein [Armatimonadota bacterium]MDR7468553.1 HAMP domain-containing protein [Armatimonadota bacterium]MDR7475146.1 HAMP domain-containing protein [Armatimonadota bacterium]
MVVALLYAWRDTRAVIAPLKDLTVAAARIADGDLGAPITTVRSDEVGALARSL